MKWIIAALLLLASCRSHDKSERDTKGRSSSVIGNTTPTATTAVVEAGVTRDPTVVELGFLWVTWNGKIRESTGKAPPVGTTCTMSAHVRSTAPDAVGQDQLNVVCGSQMLYDEHATYKGQQAWEYLLWETPVADSVSVYTYRLHASDIGARTGDRNQLTVSTKDKELIVFRENAPTFRVKIEIDPKSAPRSGKPIFEHNSPPFGVVVTAKATLTSSKGTLPFTGKTCELRISPGWTDYNCQVRLECNSKLLYGTGTSGWNHCLLSSGAPVSFTDAAPSTKDNDPELSVDLNAKTAVFADELANGSTYSANFTLEVQGI
jgi:hypothetical protein